MAKKAASTASKVNKSQAVRDYLKAHRGAAPKTVSEALKAQGIDVSAQTVSTVKFHMRKKKGKQRAARASADGMAETVSLSALVQVKKLADKLGLDKTKAALEALGKLR
jgi:hypothetical protein